MDGSPDEDLRSRAASPFRVTVVCWGNICRSPMAEFVLRAAFAQAGLDNRVVVDSAGTSTEELGRPIDTRTLSTLRRHGVPDTGFARKRARQFRAANFESTDLVLAADHVHDEILRRRARTPQEAARVRLLRSFDPIAASAGTIGMADPWYGSDEDFDTTFAQIAAATPGIVDFVRRAVAG